METTVEYYNRLKGDTLSRAFGNKLYSMVNHYSSYSKRSNTKKADVEVQYICLHLRSAELSRELETKLEILGATCIAAVADSKVYAVIERSAQVLKLLGGDPEILEVTFEEPACSK